MFPYPHLRAILSILEILFDMLILIALIIFAYPFIYVVFGNWEYIPGVIVSFCILSFTSSCGLRVDRVVSSVEQQSELIDTNDLSWLRATATSAIKLGSKEELLLVQKKMMMVSMSLLLRAISGTTETEELKKIELAIQGSLSIIASIDAEWSDVNGS